MSGQAYTCLIHSVFRVFSKMGDALLLLVFNLALAYAMRKVQAN